MNKRIIVPITDGNRQGIDDILDAAKSVFEGSMQVIEAYVIDVDSPGLAQFIEALAAKSGLVQYTAKAKAAKGGRPKKTAVELQPEAFL